MAEEYGVLDNPDPAAGTKKSGSRRENLFDACCFDAKSGLTPAAVLLRGRVVLPLKL